MSRRTPKDFARDPLTALSVMAGAALLALTLTAPGATNPASATGHRAAADLRAGPAPRLEVFDLRPGRGQQVREPVDCGLAEVPEAPGGQRHHYILDGA